MTSYTEATNSGISISDCRQLIREDAVGSNDHFPVSLVSIDRRHPNAGVRVNSSENERVGIHSVENLVKVCFKKSAVPFLDDNRIGRGNCQVRRNLATLGFFDRDPGNLGLPNCGKSRQRFAAFESM